MTECDAIEIIEEEMNLSQIKEILVRKDILLNMDQGLWPQQVNLDAPKVRQILRNLLNNALKYRNQYIEIRIKKENRFLLISVSDDGEGIQKEYHKKIFECYFQLDTERDLCVRGHGLGLAGVLILTEDMGGKMFLESEIGKGAKFSVKIPLSD